MSDFTFSEHGEDVLVHRLLLWKHGGFYLDCGAYHPRKMSLTARLRAFGWHGINIDADPRVIERFDAELPNDININLALCSGEGSVKLRRYEDPVLNTVSDRQMQHLDAIESETGLFTRKLDEIEVACSTIERVVEEHRVERIDFMNIDIEGAELSAIEGFPWGRIQPAVIAVEIHGLDLCSACDDPVVDRLLGLGYLLQSYVFHTAVFIRQSFDTEQCHRVPFETL